MKNTFLFALICLMALSGFAQGDRFSYVEDALGKKVFVSTQDCNNLLYIFVDGKVKPISKVKNVNVSLFRDTINIENSVFQYKKENFIVFKKQDYTLLLKVSDAPVYIGSFKSLNYWDKKFQEVSETYKYLDVVKGAKYHFCDNQFVEAEKFTEIEWTKYNYLDDSPMLYFKEKHGFTESSITFKSFEDIKNNIFLRENTARSIKITYDDNKRKLVREQEIKDSLENLRLKPAVFKVDKVFGSEDNQTEVNSGDTVYVFRYMDDGNFVGRFHFNNLSIEPDDIKFVDETKEKVSTGKYSWEYEYKTSSKDAEYLKSKKDSGVEERFRIAYETDSIRTHALIVELRDYLDKYKADVAYKKQHQIFITNIGYAHSDYQFGLKFNVYNCFNKTIKYVEFTMTNYNAVGDVQKDYFGHSTKTVRGIGPIEPEEDGLYTFDEVFWDEYDVIDRTRLTNIKFIFKDGSTKVFSGASNIEKHFSRDAWD